MPLTRKQKRKNGEIQAKGRWFTDTFHFVLEVWNKGDAIVQDFTSMKLLHLRTLNKDHQISLFYIYHVILPNGTHPQSRDGTVGDSDGMIDLMKRYPGMTVFKLEKPFVSGKLGLDKRVIQTVESSFQINVCL